MKWRGLASAMGQGKSRSAVSNERLARAYREVFLRDEESVEIVLADLANFTGFYQVAPPGTPPETLLYEQGLRAAFGRLFSFLSLPDERLAALEEAARREAMADSEEGIF